MWSKLLFASGLLIVCFFAFIVWAKVPTPTAENTVIQQGILSSVSSPCCQDLVLQLEGDDHVYYINHGLDLGLDWKKWEAEIEGKEIVIHWIKTNWNPFNADGGHRPVAKVELSDKVLFSMMTEAE